VPADWRCARSTLQASHSCVNDGLRPVGEVQLAQDVADAVLGCFLACKQAGRDLYVAHYWGFKSSLVKFFKRMTPV
jgi:hypothetical protein